MSPVSDKRQLLTSSQAGQLLRKNWKTVLRMAERGELHIAHKLPGPNGAYLFDAEEIQAKALEQVQAEARKRASGTLFEADQAEAGDRS